MADTLTPGAADVIGSVPVNVWNSVVLPAPFGPITECTVRGMIRRSTPPSAVNLP